MLRKIQQKLPLLQACKFRHCEGGIPRRGRKPKAPVPEEEKQYRYKIELEIGINQEYCDMVRRNRISEEDNLHFYAQILGVVTK